jgi:ParB family chromosome partitioning protein
MAKKLGGLGKGLEAIFMENYIDTANQSLVLDTSQIVPNASQPRKAFDEEELKKLSESILNYGLLQPLLVRPLATGEYQIVAGERRWRACNMAGIEEIPVTVRELSDIEVAQVALIENLQRKNLNPIEEAMGYRLLIDKYNLSKTDIASAVGRSRSTVSNTIRFLMLPKKVLNMIESGALNSGHAKALLSLKNLENAINLAQIAQQKGLSVRETEELCRRENDLEDRLKTPKAKPKRLAFFDQAEQKLKNCLPSYKSRIKTKKGKKGTLEIEFRNEDELNDILGIIAPHHSS